MPSRRTSGFRRAPAFVITLALAFVCAGVPAPQAEAAPQVLTEGGFEVLEAVQLQHADGSSYISGRLVNRTGGTAASVGLSIDQVDADGKFVWPLVGSTVGRFDDGETIRFRSDNMIGDGPYHWIVRQAWSSPARWPANLNFTTTVTDEFVDAEGMHHILGTVRNDNAVCGCNYDLRVAIGVTYLDAAGRTVGLGTGASGPSADAQWVLPGESTTFEAYGHMPGEATSYELRAEGQGNPMPLPVEVSSTGGGETIRYGSEFSLSASVMAKGVSAGANEPQVELLRRRLGATRWEPVALAMADWSGRVTLRHKPDESADYQVRVRGNERFFEASSPAIHRVNVQGRFGKPKVTSGYLSHPANNLPFYLRFPVVPSGRGHTVVLQRRVHGEWTKVGSRPTNAQGIANFLFRNTPTGKYTFRAVLKGSNRIVGTTGPSVKVTVGGPWKG